MNGNSPTFEKGKILGQHRIIRLLGRGGMGEVYEVVHDLTGKHHALKLLNPEVMKVPGAFERFQQEARVMAMLNHPGIVRVDLTGEDENRHWLRMELMPGREVANQRVVTLHEFVNARGGRLPEAEVVLMAREILDALAYAHENKLIHRDLKPANILLDPGSLKMTDFGLVETAGVDWMKTQFSENPFLVEPEETPRDSLSNSQSQTMLGTYGFMSPEQRMGKPSDARSDLYAVGLIVFRMLTGLMSPSMKRASEMDLGLNRKWDDWLLKALEENPDDRYSSAQLMQQELGFTEDAIIAKAKNSSSEASKPQQTNIPKSTFAKPRGIQKQNPVDPSDPLYSDLAHAMRGKNLENALSILRVITERNKSDKKAQEQLERTELEVVKTRIELLYQLANQRDEEQFKSAISSFHQEPWSDEPKGALWNEIIAYEEELRIHEVYARCKHLIDKSIKSKREKNWKEAANHIREVDELRRRDLLDLREASSANPDKSYEQVLEICRKWLASEKRAKRKREEDSQRESKLKFKVRTIMDKDIGRRRKADHLKEDLAALTSLGRNLQDADQSLDDEDLNNFNRCLSSLKSELGRRQKALRMFIALGCAVAILLASFTFHAIAEKLSRDKDWESFSNGIVSNVNIDNLEAFIDLFEKSYPDRLKEQEFASEMQKARSKILKSRKSNDDFSEKIQAFMEDLDDAKDLEALRELQGRKKLLHEALNTLNIAHLDAQQDAVKQADFGWNAKRDRLQRGLSQNIVDLLNNANSFAAEKLSLDEDEAILRENLIEMNKILNDLDAEEAKFAGLDGVGFSDGQLQMIRSMDEIFENRRSTIEAYDKAVGEMKNGNTLDVHMSALDSIVKSGFRGGSLYEKAKSVLLVKSSLKEMEGRAFLQDDFQNWNQVGNYLSEKLTTGTMVDKEISFLKKLYKEERLEDIYKTRLLVPGEKLQRLESIDEKWVPILLDQNRGAGYEFIWTRGNKIESQVEFQQGTEGSKVTRTGERNDGSYLVSQKVKLISGRSFTNATFESEWWGVGPNLEKRADKVMVSGEVFMGGAVVPDGSVWSNETSYLHAEDSKVLKIFGDIPKVNGVPLVFIDSLKSDPINAFIKARIFHAVMQSLELRPHEWGLMNDPRRKLQAVLDYEKLLKIISGLDLVAEWYTSLTESENKENLVKFENFFENASKVSYYREAKFFGRFWKQLIESQFVYQGYCKTDDSWTKPGLQDTWGISPKKARIQMVREGGSESIPLGPIFKLDRDMVSILANARLHAGYDSIKDPDYEQAKRKLPYPFPFVPEK